MVIVMMVVSTTGAVHMWHRLGAHADGQRPAPHRDGCGCRWLGRGAHNALPVGMTVPMIPGVIVRMIMAALPVVVPVVVPMSMAVHVALSVPV
jgi:hypothetical protein